MFGSWVVLADGVQASLCTLCWRARLPSGTGNRCWCCVWSWVGSTTSLLPNGRIARTPSRTWYAVHSEGRPIVLHVLCFPVSLQPQRLALAFCPERTPCWSYKTCITIVRITLCWTFFKSLQCFQISRMLVVDPKQRYTARDALNHPFFSQYVVAEVRQFTPYRRFKVRWPNVCGKLHHSKCKYLKV